VKSLFGGLMVTTVFALAGCGEGTPGGPGAVERTANKPVFGQADDTFNLDVPKMSTKLKQGETKELAISVARGKNFDEDVTLKFASLPKGVTFDPASPVIVRGNKEAKVAVRIAGDTAPGEFTVKVSGEPKKGAAATSEIKITVAKK
jgi:hypothetical protein